MGGTGRRLRRRFSLASLVAVALAAVAPTGAGAATTLGQTFAPELGCDDDTTFLQTGSGGPSYTVPSDGVITSWSFQAAAPPPLGMKFKVARPLPGTSLSGAAPFTVIGESAPVNPVANSLNTYPLQIAVKAGDMIGLYTGAVDTRCVRSSPGDRIHAFSGDARPGQQRTFTAGPGFQLDVSANLETQRCGGKVPTIAGTPGNDTLTGTNGPDVIVGLGGDDKIKGFGGKDLICGGDGADIIKGANRADRLFGQNGRDRLFGGAGKDALRGGAGKDKLYGRGNRDDLKGNRGDDKLGGGGGNDILRGNKGNDKLFGQGGKDICKGGAKRDKAKGCEVEKSI